MDAQAFDVLNQRPSCVVLKRGVGPRLATAALVEQDHLPFVGVEVAPHGRVDSPARAAVQDDARFASRIAADLIKDFMRPIGGHEPLVERLALTEKTTAISG